MLPKTSDQRWTIARKKSVIDAVNSGEITRKQAMTAYNISEEELSSWIGLSERFGIKGLRVTRLRDYLGER